MPSESSPDVKFEIGHVLFIDIVGYSKLLITEQSDQLQNLKQIVRGTEQFRLADAEGKLLRLPTGDGGALVFRTTPEAPVLCALEISKALRNYPELRVRMGIHSGPVNDIADLNEQANIAGAGINIAQRVMDCGDAGHILLSRHVAEDLEHYPRWRPFLHDSAECEVKHGVRIGLVNFYGDGVGNAQIPKKLQILVKQRRTRWAAIAAALLLLMVTAFIMISKKSGRSTSSIVEKSIAVLPFENLSSDKENAYFAEGIQDEILTRLSKIADLKVISHTSTQHYKSAPENLPEIARQLGVAHILEGSVQKSGDAVRVNVQLIKAADDTHLWAETFDRKLTDLFSAESEVAKAIADQLRVKITGREQQVISAKPTDVPEAYNAYLRGLAYSLRPGNTPTNSLGAQKYLKEAVRLDPKFALAWALLGVVEANGYSTTVLQRTPSLLEDARHAADTALSLQPNLGEALYAKGYFHYGCLKDYDTAVRYFQQSHQFSPNDSQIPAALAYIARRRGDWSGSVRYFDEAEELNPRGVRALDQHAFSLLGMRRFQDAVKKLDQVLDIAPDDIDALVIKASIEQGKGDLAAAGALLAPLQIPVTNPVGVQTQLRQSIFERNPAAGVPRLKETMSNADPATNWWFIGELRFYLGWAQHLAGDDVAAETTYRQARRELEESLKQQPQNSFVMGALGLVNMALGDKTAAFRFAEQGILANPVKRDAVYGPAQIEILARVAAQTGETDRAIAGLEKLLGMPYGNWGPAVPLTPAILRLDPMFDPLRSDPRFQKLCEERPK
jgi:TolB-like protein/tetratricopeptide (TPR) repeat protein